MDSNKTFSQYAVMARRYRPQRLEDIIGQETTIKILKNALAAENFPSAILLTGIQGTGKTTTARILAKTLNCDNSQSGQTCEICNSCKAISHNRSQDILEINAAYYTGIDDMRELIENAKHRPLEGKIKVHIIDEIHMLSGPAFQALSKFLQEIPKHLKFIFATTEIQKVPQAILANCMHFGLNPVPVETLARYLQIIARREDKEITPDAATMLASATQGSVRDALSILEAAISYGSGSITVDDLEKLLSLSDRRNAIAIFEAICRGNISEAILEYRRQTTTQAIEPHKVLYHLAQICHDIAVLKATGKKFPELLYLPQSDALAQNLDTKVLVRLWKVIEASLEEIQHSTIPLASVEMSLIRMAHSSLRTSPQEYLDRLDAIPRREILHHSEIDTTKPGNMSASPEIQAILDAFPDAVIKSIH